MDGVNDVSWSVVVPLKPLALAKSRLAAAGGVRRALALAFALDTVAAALACEAVADVTVVTDDPTAGAELAALGAFVVPDAPGGRSERGAAARRAGRPAAPGGRRGRGAERRSPGLAARGTVLGAPGGRWSPAAGVPGRRGRTGDNLAHGGGATSRSPPGSAAPPAPATSPPAPARSHCATVPGVRQDVDTAEDLRAALALGVGPRTLAAAQGLLIPD